VNGAVVPPRRVREQGGVRTPERIVEADTSHTEDSTAERGLEFMLGFYGLLNRAPKGRAEGDPPDWIRRHDEYQDRDRVE
jgi:predicted dithiol-disulfide oxidoreductase (DUF899 family)